MTDEELELAIAGAKKLVRQALIGTVLAVLVAAIVLAIDMGIKRAVLDEVVKARGILDEFKKVANGTTQADQAGAGNSGGVGAGDGVVGDARVPAMGDPVQDAAASAPGDVEAGLAGGSPGDG